MVVPAEREPCQGRRPVSKEPESEKNTLGARLRQARDLRGISQYELARRARISRAFLSNVEGDRKTPSERTVADVAAALDVSAFWLLSGEGSPAPRRDLVEDLRRVINELPEQVRGLVARAITDLGRGKWGVVLDLTEHEAQIAAAFRESSEDVRQMVEAMLAQHLKTRGLPWPDLREGQRLAEPPEARLEGQLHRILGRPPRPSSPPPKKDK